MVQGVAFAELVHRRGAPASGRADAEAGVGHAKRVEYALGQHVGQRLVLIRDNAMPSTSVETL